MHINSLTYGQSIMLLYDGTWYQLHNEGSCMIYFYMMGLGGTNFTMREVPFSANTYPNYHYDIYQDTFSTYDIQIL